MGIPTLAPPQSEVVVSVWAVESGHVRCAVDLRVTATRYLKWESYLVIDGVCTKNDRP